ncbi:hypothetical protein DUT90_00545 [Polaribacter sp. WD7]|uniref:hypothetical protein n=1 Tax=Polaribacter sp. WD7 TaxID=2269061 RepID=UPI000DF146DC|nr:hypothetical protein [Polaribacter sp. WD7]RCS28447.1 hypothetical protein DUT90_00545 [Polaribacter sp. WD7]
MKRKKNRIIKNISLGITLSIFLLISCNNYKKEAGANKQVVAEVLDNQKDSKVVESKKEEIKTRTYKMKDGTALVYNLDAKGIVGFDDWNDYAIVNSEIVNFKKVNFKTTEARMRHLNYRIANLSNTIPPYLKTEEVLEDVADIQKEYKELIEDTNASEKEVAENLEEVYEKFDDLKEELNETMERYIKIHDDAIEEFIEEYKEGKIMAAIEEYNEEIKELDKMIEKK